MRAFTIVLSLFLLAGSAFAQEAPSCKADDKACLLSQLETVTGQIAEKNWQDQMYRELAKLLTLDKQADKAVALIARIDNPDTKAMTIRAIGMAAADTGMKPEEYTPLFSALRAEAEKITHPPSYAIALTYIAMGQAFAGDNAGAMQTARDMENDALRNKAFGESAEIQAERGDIVAAMASIAAIDSPAFRNKAHGIISKIFADRKKYDEALKTAMAIDNHYLQAQAILYILAKQISPEEVSLVE